MKSKLHVVVVWLVGTLVASAQPGNYNFSSSPNKLVPDDNFNGISFTQTISGISSPIANVTVTLDITDGFNGDLYGYLRGPNGGFAVLLNRVGVNGGDGFGYGDSGFSITLNDSASFNNIHSYQNDPYDLSGGGQLMGTWSSDGRNISPISDPATLAATQPSAMLTSFGGTNPNGNWTLFLSDLSSGGQSTLVNWSVAITTVPEPSTAIFLVAAALLWTSNKLIRLK